MIENASTVELGLCKELALIPGSHFEFTSRFLSATRQEPLLALYALKQSISSIPQIPVEDSVKWAKLKWWNEELTADPDSSSRHPILRVLWLSGARHRLNNALLQQLVRDAILQIDVAPTSDEDSMFERLSSEGSTDIQLELALDNADIEARSLAYLGAATRLFHVISSFGPDHRSETEQLPLNLLAKYGISQVEADQEQDTEGFKTLVMELAEIGLDWFSRGKAGLMTSSNTGASTHLQLRLAMEKRQLTAIKKNANTIFKLNQRFGPADAWFAWRFLRRLK